MLAESIERTDPNETCCSLELAIYLPLFVTQVRKFLSDSRTSLALIPSEIGL